MKNSKTINTILLNLQGAEQALLEIGHKRLAGEVNRAHYYLKKGYEKRGLLKKNTSKNRRKVRFTRYDLAKRAIINVAL